MTRFQIPIGDWSNDGHGKVEWFYAEAVKDIEEIREAYFNAKSKFSVNPESFCNNYGEVEVSNAAMNFLKQHYPHLPLGREDDDPLVPQDMAEFVVWFLNQGDPELYCELLEEKAPMLQFYGLDEKKRHIGFFGYGLFE